MNIKKLPVSLAFVLITLAAMALLWGAGFFSKFDITLYDFLLGVKVQNAPHPLNPYVVPVDLNDKTEMNMESRLDDRSAFGDVFSVIAHSRAVAALDFIYKGERNADRYILESAAGLQAVFIAVVPVPKGRENVSYRMLTDREKSLMESQLWHPKVFGKNEIPEAGTFIMPFIELGEISTQLGHISIDPDSDGIYRRTPLFYAWEDGYVPSLSLAAACWDLHVDTSKIEIYPGREVVIPLGPDDKISIPIDLAGNVVVPFGGKWAEPTHRYSFDDLANALYDEAKLSEVRNDLMRSLCFVADTTFEKKDLGPVPFEKVYLLSGLHTWVISAILDASAGDDTFYKQVPMQYCVIILAGFTLIFIFAGLSVKDWLFNSIHAFIFLAFTGITLYLWFVRRYMPWYGAALLLILMPWILGFIRRFLTQRKMQSVLKRYVPRSVSHKLAAEERGNLVPVNKELTIMFTDISGFTTWSANRPAKDVHDFLDDYFGSMVDILFKHEATVDKFIGDGILSFFGDPVPMPNTATAAISAAIAMQREIKNLAAEWKPKVGIDLKVRMGINTGNVVVGDLGTSKRIEYTVIGSAVNLAQRMESISNAGGILITEFTRNAVNRSRISHPFNFSKKTEHKVKGYPEPVATYEVIFEGMPGTGK
ncbi:MAG: CHASE2 domain-containing protein [Treponema sp.]|nr:CHASE2 domain-containing protein [Treponema sp.]